MIAKYSFDVLRKYLPRIEEDGTLSSHNFTRRFLACVLVAILHPSETDASISLACQKSQRENTIALAQIAATETNL